MLGRAVLLSLTLCSGLMACSDRPDGSVPATSPQQPTLAAHDPDPVNANDAESVHDASIADASPASREPIDARADAGNVTGLPFLGRYIINARDLGGIRLPGQTRVAFGRLFRGPVVATLAGNGCEAFAGTGVRTVVDLRTPSETASQPDAMCVGEHAQTVLAPLPNPSSGSAQEYVAMLDERDSVAKFFTLLADPSAYPVYFHCSWGRDRTGVAAALILLVLGAARQDITHDYLLSRQTGGVTPEPIEATLDEIERRGGVEAYLSTIGISADRLDALRHEAIEPLP